MTYIILVAFGSIYLTWILYLAVMNLDRAKHEGKLNGLAYAMGMPLLIVGLLLDTFVNVFIMSLLMLELPKETLVTKRLSRHYTSNTWRGRFARKFSELLLDPFDRTGNHID